MGVALALAKPAPAKSPAPAPPRVMLRPAARLLQRACDCGSAAGLSGRCTDCDRTSLGPAHQHDRGASDLGLESMQAKPATTPQTGQNLATLGILSAARTPPRVQTSLRVSAPGDAAEREATTIGRLIVRMPDPAPGVLQTGSGVQREAMPAAAPTAAAPHLVEDLKSHASAGTALPRDMASFMEPRFGADFSAVRIHTGEHAAKLAAQLGARAFTHGRDIYFGRDQFRPGAPEGWELIAHELTHSIQQGAALQRPPTPAPAPAAAPPQVAPPKVAPPKVAPPKPSPAPAQVAQRAPPAVQRLGVGDALNFFADKANIIPGFRMLTLVLGVNPINMTPVDRSAANLLRALIEFLPGGGIVTQALQNSGVFDKVGAWVTQQIATLAMTGAALKDAVTSFLGSLSFSDIFDLGGVWERARHIFTDPIDKLIAFAKGLAADILKFIKDAILLPLAKLAEGTKGWDLLIAVLGRNPITGETVPRTAETLIGGFLKLIGQDEVWDNMKKSNAIPRAWAWFQGAMSAVVGFVSRIPDLFLAAFKSLTVEDVVLVAGAFQKVAAVFGGFLGQFTDWAGTAIWNLLEIIFDVVSPGALTYIKKTGAALRSILKNPLPFVGNLVKAAKLGLQNFVDHFGSHLKQGLIDWLTGSLQGVYIPKALSLVELGKFALSVLGISWAQIRAKIVKALGANGETIMKAMETGFDIVVALIKGGVAAVWELIKEKLTGLKDMVVDGIVGFVTSTIIEKAIPKLISLFIPGAGFISAILSIYDTIKVFIEKLAKLVAVVKAFVDSIVAIASGDIASAAARVESTLAGLLSLAISFLAGFLGLGNITAKIMEVVKKAQALVDKALDTAIAWILSKAKALFGAAKSAIGRWWQARKTLKTDTGEAHTLSFAGQGSAARLMIQSAPQTVTSFVAAKQSEAATDPKKAAAISAINQQLAKLATLEALPDAEQTAREAEFTATFNAIGDQITILLNGGDWGSPQNPLPLEYPKRRAAAYPILYFGPKTSRTIPQTVLKTQDPVLIRSKMAPGETWDGKVTVYNPLSPLALPGSGPTIGLSGDFQVAVGTKVQYDPGKTGGGGKINAALKPYGYSPSGDGMDGDHVVERQLGGPDELQNLWPLDKSENRSSGSILSKATVQVEGKPLGLKDAQEKRQKEKSQTLWLIIVSTREQ